MLREKALAQTEKPLAGKRIVVTRAPEQAQNLLQRLRDLGAEALLMPTICFAPPTEWSALDTALREIVAFDWILFTSANSVRFFSKRMRELDLSRKITTQSKLRIGAVGRTTAEVLASEGLCADYVGKDQTGEALITDLCNELVGKEVLLPRSDRADETLPAALRAVGARITEVVAYRTQTPDHVDPEILAAIRRGATDAIIFSSPSAFYNLRDLLDKRELVTLAGNTAMVVIGPTTARALRENRVNVAIEAEEASSSGIAAAIVEYFQKKTITARPA